MIRVKPLSLGFGDYLSLNEVEVDGRICNLRTINTNVATGPNVDVRDVNFELKLSLINMVQASPFYGKPNEDANAHLQNLLELCETVVIRGIAAAIITLLLFPFSLLGKAK
jgi:hypothetical protein